VIFTEQALTAFVTRASGSGSAKEAAK
jgi:hypothetical protein